MYVSDIPGMYMNFSDAKDQHEDTCVLFFNIYFFYLSAERKASEKIISEINTRN